MAKTSRDKNRLPFKLSDLRLLTCAARQATDGSNNKELPSLEQSVQVEVGRLKDDPKQLKLFVTFNLVDIENKESGFHIAAVFGVTFRSLEASFSDDAGGEFGKTVGVHIVWPYWREFVQSMTSRMSLPPLRIPLVNAAKLPFGKMAQQEVVSRLLPGSGNRKSAKKSTKRASRK